MGLTLPPNFARQLLLDAQQRLLPTAGSSAALRFAFALITFRLSRESLARQAERLGNGMTKSTLQGYLEWGRVASYELPTETVEAALRAATTERELLAPPPGYETMQRTRIRAKHYRETQRAAIKVNVQQFITAGKAAIEMLKKNHTLTLLMAIDIEMMREAQAVAAALYDVAAPFVDAPVTPDVSLTDQEPPE